MTAPRSDFLRILQDRGFIHQCTDLAALDARALDGPVTAYIGFDATAGQPAHRPSGADHDAALAAEDRP